VVEVERTVTQNSFLRWVTQVKLTQNMMLAFCPKLKFFELLVLACFLEAIQAMAKRMGKEEMGEKAVVHSSVHIGTVNNMEGFGLAVDIKVEGIDEELLKAADKVCLDS
jgi:hypothetical protein